MNPEPDALESGSNRNVLHPFLGFSGVPGSTLRSIIHTGRMATLIDALGVNPEFAWPDRPANNHGFMSPYDYPLRSVRGEEESFVVAVGGGSCSHWLATAAAGDLAKAFESSGISDGRQVIVLNIATGGFRHIQTQSMLSYLLAAGQSLDVVVIVDGFGDVRTAVHNAHLGFDPSTISATHLVACGGEDNLPRLKEPISIRDAVANGVESWRTLSGETHQLLLDHDIPAVQLVQPNQYFTKKEFTLAERDMAIDEHSLECAAVRGGYEGLQVAVATLRAEGSPVVDATDLFDSTKETIFIDTCCHYNRLGNLLLIERICAELRSLDSA